MDIIKIQMVKISIIPLEVLIGIIEEMEKLIGMFGIVFKFIKNNEYVYYSLYSVLSLAIIFIFYKYIKLLKFLEFFYVILTIISIVFSMIEETESETFREFGSDLIKNAVTVIKSLVKLPREKKRELIAALSALIKSSGKVTINHLAQSSKK